MLISSNELTIACAPSNGCTHPSLLITGEPMSLKKLQITLARTRVAYWKAKVAVAEAQLAELGHLQKPEDIDLSTFRPEWKNGLRLSPAGVVAIFAAFDRHKRIKETAGLFRISERSAGVWHGRWEKRQLDT
jgi:hypothetical protein